MSQHQAPLLAQVALQTLAIYLFLVVLLRLIGRRLLSELSVIDLLLVVMLGSAVETSMVVASTNLEVGIVAACVLLLANKALTSLHRKYRWFRILMGGQPVLVVHDGEIIESHLRRLGLNRDEVMEALREREQGNLANIKFAVFEPDGEINVIPKDMAVHCADLPDARKAAE